MELETTTRSNPTPKEFELIFYSQNIKKIPCTGYFPSLFNTIYLRIRREGISLFTDEILLEVDPF